MRFRILVIVAAFQATTAVHTMAQVPPAAATTRAAPPTTSAGASRPLLGTRDNIVTTIQGTVLTSGNSALVNGTVRLRDARSGRVVYTTITDASGGFAFRTIDPGTYIVEIVGKDQTVLAASELITVNSGDLVAAVVKLPSHVPALGGVLGNTASSALAITAEAAGLGILATRVSGSPVSGRPIS